MTDSQPMNRRGFIRVLPVVASGGMGLFQSGCSGLPYLRGTPVGTRVRIDAADLGASARAFVEVPGRDRPLFVHRTEDASYVAVLAECTHRRCTPEPEGDRLVCPCHGSEYTLSGELLEGPAERDLPRFPVAEDGLRLLIDLGVGP